MKKFNLYILSFAMLLSVLLLPVCAENATVMENGILYSADKTILLNCTEKYDGGDTLIIPDGVTEIGDGAFMGNTTISRILFPASLQKIGNDAFRDSALTTADLSGCKALTVISNSAFAGCINLTAVSVPTNTQTLEESVFHGCSSLQSVFLPETVIPDSCFIDCKMLQSVVIVLPDDTQKIYRTGKMAPNAEDEVSAADARLILRLAAGLDLTLEYMIFGADVNRDGKITAVDARAVLRVAAHLDTF